MSYLDGSEAVRSNATCSLFGVIVNRRPSRSPAAAISAALGQISSHGTMIRSSTGELVFALEGPFLASSVAAGRRSESRSIDLLSSRSSLALRIANCVPRLPEVIGSH